MNMNNFDCVTVSWSSKGTQIAVGRKDGVIVQFDHVSVLSENLGSRFIPVLQDFHAKREIPFPTSLGSVPRRGH